MRFNVFLISVLLFGIAAPADAQSLLGYIERCAVGGMHQAGCFHSDPSCVYAQHIAGTCPQIEGTGEPIPTEPVPAPEPVPTLTAPTNLLDAGDAITARHDGRLTSWYVLLVDGQYHTHAGMSALAEGRVTLPFVSTLAAGAHTVAVQACSDTLGCVVSAPLEVTR